MPESFTDQFAASTDNAMVIGIRKHFEDAAENFATAAASLAPVIEDASGRIVNAFMANHRVFTCGNGAADYAVKPVIIGMRRTKLPFINHPPAPLGTDTVFRNQLFDKTTMAGSAS